MSILKQKIFFLFLNICQASEKDILPTEITTRQNTLNNGRKITYITSKFHINEGIKNIVPKDIENSIDNIKYIKENNQFQIKFNENIPETSKFYLPKDDENFLNRSVLVNNNLKFTDLIEVIINTIKDVNNQKIKELIEELKKIKTSKYAEYFSINSLEFNNFDKISKTFKKINLTISADVYMHYKKKEGNKTTSSSKLFNNNLLTVEIENNIVNYPSKEIKDTFFTVGLGSLNIDNRSLNIDKFEEELRAYKNMGWEIGNSEKNKNIKSDNIFENSIFNGYVKGGLLIVFIGGIIYLVKKNK